MDKTEILHSSTELLEEFQIRLRSVDVNVALATMCALVGYGYQVAGKLPAPSAQLFREHICTAVGVTPHSGTKSPQEVMNDHAVEDLKSNLH